MAGEIRKLKGSCDMNPLATKDQSETEALALKLIQTSTVRAAREKARALMLACPLSKSFDAVKGLDRALDQWVMELTMREANNDYHRPKFVWSCDNEQRAWFGRTYPGAAVAIDNPDNVNREAHIDGAGSYEVRGKFSEKPTASFSIMIETNAEHHGALGRNLGTLTHRTLKCDPDGSFLVTIDPRPADGRPNHLQTEPGRVALYTRDSFSDWTQIPSTLEVRRVDGAKPEPARSEAEIADRIAKHLPDFVAFWLDFATTFLGFPEPNTIVGPNGREGGWGYLAAGRFLLADDEALVITATDGGGGYTGFQLSDAWTIAPDPVYQTSSMNKSQGKANPDGSVTYVVAPIDPGYANWIDTVSMHEGWFLLRWQAMPATSSAEGLVRSVKLVKTKDLASAVPKDTPRADLDYRRAQIAERVSGRHWRLREN
jgi:Protein of unknown function (DUF1214)